MLNNENVKNLFESLMSEIDLDEERKILIENEVNFNEDDLKSFHEKKNELLKVLKENKKSLEKLDSDDMLNVSGGSNLTAIASGTFSFLFSLVLGHGWQGSATAAGISYASALSKDVLFHLLEKHGYTSEWFLSKTPSFFRDFVNGHSVAKEKTT